MKPSTLVILAIPAAALAIARPAAADPDIYLELPKAGDAINGWNDRPWIELSGSPENCRAAVTAARKAKPDSTVFEGAAYKYSPGAVKASHGGSPQPYQITLGQAMATCDELDRVLRLSKVHLVLQKTKDHIGKKDQYTKTLTPESGPKLVAEAEACMKAVDDALAGGAHADDAIAVYDDKTTLAAARTTYCEGLDAWGKGLPALIEEAKAEDKAAREAPWKAAGFKGGRLEAFAYYGPEVDGWFVRGCKEADRKAFKKATAAYRWLYTADGGHMIQKYTFKGDKVASITERTFDTEAKAYAIGCK